MVLLLASCGKQHQTKVLVKEFMAENLTEPKAMSGLTCRQLDSTRLISDSLVSRMRQSLKQRNRYKADTRYADGTIPRTLFFTRVKYRLYDQECEDTYYLDPDLTRVIAVKQN